MGYAAAGIVSALAIIFLLLKLDFKKVLYYELPIDVTVAALFCFMFSGSYAGEVAAMTGGAVFSIFLFICRRTIGYKKPSRLWTRWTDVPGAWVHRHA